MAMRMLFSMAITLYTSRVVLQQLGVDDFGIYSVVAGLAIIMSFFTSALTAAIQRYMNVELAVTRGDGMQQVFSASWVCVLAMSAIFLLLAEGAGLWFLNNKLNIPPGRLGDAQIVFQMSLLIVVVEMLRVPYNSLIIAHERMAFYAYNSIIEVGLKLGVAVSLTLIPGNKLLIFMAMLIAIAVLINGSFAIYCRHILPAIRFRLKASRAQIVEIGKFAGWNVLTSLSDISYQQGSSMILNIFYGVALNATMGITNQIKTAVFSFTRSLQTAANPQIVQTFAAGQIDEFTKLFIRISKISFYSVAFLGIPIYLNADYILSIWLIEVPPMGAIFARLIIIFCMIDSLVGPLWVTMQASGNIARYQIVVSTIWILCLPTTYLAYKAGMPSYSLLTVMIAIDAFLIIIRVKFTEHHCHVPAAVYYTRVILNVLAVLAAALVLPLAVDLLLPMTPLATLLTTTALWVVTMAASIYFIGLSRDEKTALRAFIATHLPLR
ncbi:MAG: hypothetical protein J1E63_02340 [Muribaculaceae bacterium]|nr:hypothetical protein [Muribaculaceae bacterium]